MNFIKTKHMRLLVIISVIFLVVSGVVLLFSGIYIKDRLLQSGEGMATDIALLVKNNFQITDAEVKHLKTLTFNEMERDPINNRLMDVGNGVALNAEVRNVYLVAQLSKDEYRYCPDEETADTLGFSIDEPLNGIWLLNGKIDSNGLFEVATREDIYRYTVLDKTQLEGINSEKECANFSKDSWGSFITGYVPIYTVEGNFVGLLGIDMDPDPFLNSAQNLIIAIIVLFFINIIVVVSLSFIFFQKYLKAREDQRKYRFFSSMSHEIRTPMNGIIGTALLSKTETDISVLQHNAEVIEESGNNLLKLINKALDYKNTDEKTALPNVDVPPKRITDLNEQLTILKDKKILICEDHPINAEILCRMLSKVGCAPETAFDGKQGLDKFSQSELNYFDCILMDLNMPNMNGYEATEKIRSLDRNDAKNIPIIAVTANFYDEDIKKSKAAGMNEHLTKPVEPQKLYEVISYEINSYEKLFINKKSDLPK